MNLLKLKNPGGGGLEEGNRKKKKELSSSLADWFWLKVLAQGLKLFEEVTGVGRSTPRKAHLGMWQNGPSFLVPCESLYRADCLSLQHGRVNVPREQGRNYNVFHV
jgi:hypothetical protein